MNEEKLKLILKFCEFISNESKGHKLRIQYSFKMYIEGAEENEGLGPGYLLTADWRDENDKWKESSIYLEI